MMAAGARRIREGKAMRTRGSLVRVGVTFSLVLALGLATAAPANASTVRHRVDVSHFDAHWPCPGRDPVEHATTTVHTTEFWVGGVRVRSIEHWLWKGRLENRETGALMRDDGAWTTVNTFGPTGKQVIRSSTSGAVWRFTVPGQGIVVHQTGRSVVGDAVEFASTFGGSADSSPLCAFV
jgi:hypothetical protein